MPVNNTVVPKESNTKLLLIEDDREIATALCQMLAPLYQVTHVTNGTSGLQKAISGKYDILILDLQLPDMHGLVICQELRERDSAMPVLVLTGQSRIIDKIRLLDAGADDYLTKPFSLGELKARLRVLHRRGQQPLAEAEVLSVGDLIIDRQRHQVRRADQIINLRPKEFSLLECLMLHAGTVVSRSILGHYAWRRSDRPWTNTIDVHIKHLRDKVDHPFNDQLIYTVHGLGYKIEPPNSLDRKRLL